MSSEAQSLIDSFLALRAEDQRVVAREILRHASAQGAGSEGDEAELRRLIEEGIAGPSVPADEAFSRLQAIAGSLDGQQA